MKKTTKTLLTWIGVIAPIIAALIVGSFSLFKKSGGDTKPVQKQSPDGVQAIQKDAKESTLTVQTGPGDKVVQTGTNNIQATQSFGSSGAGSVQVPFAVYGGSGNTFIVGGDSDTKKAVEAFEIRLSRNETNVDLTRNELKLLTKALRDLDERTSGMMKLPDGRTRYVNLVGGEPTVLLGEYELACSCLSSNRWSEAYEHSRKAIDLYEAGRNLDGEGVNGVYLVESVASWIYYAAAVSSQHLGNETGDQKYKELAYEYANKAIAHTNEPTIFALVASTSFHLGKWDEATNYIQRALAMDPNSTYLLDMQSAIYAGHSTR